MLNPWSVIAAVMLSTSTQAAEAPRPLVACDGIEVQSVDLSGQFPPTVQQEPGLCWAYTPTALIEAALFRKEGRRVKLDERYLACKSRQLDDSLAPSDSELSKGISFLDGGRQSEALKQAVKNCKVVEQDTFSAVYTGFIQFEKIAQTRPKASRTISKENAKLVSSFEASLSDSPNLSSLGLKVQEVPIRHRVFAGDFFESKRAKDILRTRNNGISFVKDWLLPESKKACDPGRPEVQETFRRIVDSLCRGLPLGVSFNVGGGSWDGPSPDSEFWSFHRTKSGAAAHTAVIVGVSRNALGEPTLILRDTRRIDEVEKRMFGEVERYAAIGISEVCKITELVALVSETDLPKNSPGPEARRIKPLSPESSP